MIYVVHRNNYVLKILDSKFQVVSFETQTSITTTLFSIAEAFPKELIIWCHEVYVDFINESPILDIFHHKRIIASYSVSNNTYIPNQIGYVDQSIFIKVNYNVTYPTWLMSSDIGGIHAELLNTISKAISKFSNFDYFINSLAKITMPQGVFCYSEPKLLKENTSVKTEVKQASKYELFKFVKQHYKWFWAFMLTFCFAVFEKKWTLLPLIKSIFNKKNNLDLDKIEVKSNRQIINKKEVDVIIPTIGRKKYLYDVLKDLKKQTIIPKNVIIVEQNPDKNSESELDYLLTETWPFKIKHTFTNITGVCNARNLGLPKVESEWVFLADDDIRFENNLFEASFKKIETLGISVLNYLCLQPHQQQTYFNTSQTIVFGSGSSMVKTSIIKNLKFDMVYEFGFGEDSDFGMQVRNKGTDVIFIPDIKITHLKAPMGGFRTKIKKLWDDEKVQPKPSPTIMLFFKKYFTSFQVNGYKTILFIKFFRKQKVRNPYTYLMKMRKQWEQSDYWSSILMENKND
ncbi:glycosyltransferase family 2 protein [Flavivirga spongiicola]|uniref:Glycosyltransferase family 2 protein n=1 Tax=Flavivirga spongiicola TaxID=421621 RepID=A0ABU7XN76_9FLAO|nr:glycosyltransferase family A protein [Flavivirga sp. MEBiC05379]MDO5981675.1 glycosyltransferase family A protein [Flavivirga sp. MEBiC05379]